MGCDYNYKCTKATLIEDMGTTVSGVKMVFASLEFENEHGHEMASVKAIVVLGDNAHIATEPEEILGLSPTDDEGLFGWDDAAQGYNDRLLSGDVGFDIYNCVEISKILEKQLCGWDYFTCGEFIRVIPEILPAGSQMKVKDIGWSDTCFDGTPVAGLNTRHNPSRWLDIKIRIPKN